VIRCRGFGSIIGSVSVLLTIIESFAVRSTGESVAMGSAVRLTVGSVVKLTAFGLFLDPFGRPLLHG
jgi:hypothetical protein